MRKNCMQSLFQIYYQYLYTTFLKKVHKAVYSLSLKKKNYWWDIPADIPDGHSWLTIHETQHQVSAVIFAQQMPENKYKHITLIMVTIITIIIVITFVMCSSSALCPRSTHLNLIPLL